jgi:Arc/MetJ-type ribon-helix-helix transcriptional regulator
MEIEIKPDAEEWLRAQVAQGRFASLDEAVETLVREDQIMQAGLEGADLAWTKPYLAKGIADIDAGRTIPAEQVHSELRARFISPRKS